MINSPAEISSNDILAEDYIDTSKWTICEDSITFDTTYMLY